MPFIPEDTQETMRKRLRDTVDPVTLRHSTREHDCRYCRETPRLLAELSGLFDKLKFEVHYVDVDTKIAQSSKIDKFPRPSSRAGKTAASASSGSLPDSSSPHSWTTS